MGNGCCFGPVLILQTHPVEMVSLDGLQQILHKIPLVMTGELELMSLMIPTTLLLIQVLIDLQDLVRGQNLHTHNLDSIFITSLK